MYNPFSLEGKTYLITGASSGIGMAVAIECSRMGANVILTGRSQQRLQTTLNQLEDGNNLMIVSDLTKKDGIEILLSNIPILDGIVHCAGLTKYIPFQFATKEQIDCILNINFYAPAEVSRKILKEKKIKKNGSIVFISSISGIFCSSVASSIYSASKGAINGLAKGMALDLAQKGIRVNCVNPGIIETSIFDSGSVTREQLEEEKKRYPLKRFGQPKEVAHAVIYLLSDTSSWVTGTNLLIDGGFTLL